MLFNGEVKSRRCYHWPVECEIARSNADRDSVDIPRLRLRLAKFSDDEMKTSLFTYRCLHF